MSHVDGHIDYPIGSFGVLLPKLEYGTPELGTPEDVKKDFEQFLEKLGSGQDQVTVDLKKIIKGNETEVAVVVNFPILFAPPKDVTVGSKTNNDVGFHPYLIPWEERFLAIASDITIWKNHTESEAALIKKVNENPKVKEKVKRVEELHVTFDDALIDFFLSAPPPSLPKDQRNVLKDTGKYMKTTSFKTIYLWEKGVRSSNDVVKWMIENTIHLHKTGFRWKTGELTFPKLP